MDSRLKRLIKKHHVKVVYLPIDRNGYLIRGKINKVFVKSSLTDEETEKVILHEIGHLERDSNVVGSYKSNYATRVSCEYGANCYLIQEKVKQYIALGNDAIKANYIDLANSLGVEDYNSVRHELSKYLIE